MKVSIPYGGLTYLQLCRIVGDFVAQANRELLDPPHVCSYALDELQAVLVHDGKYYDKSIDLPSPDSGKWMHYNLDISEEAKNLPRPKSFAWLVDDCLDQLMWQLWFAAIEAVENGDCQVQHAQRLAMTDNIYRRQKKEIMAREEMREIHNI